MVRMSDPPEHDAVDEPFLRLDRWRAQRAYTVGEAARRHLWSCVEHTIFRISPPRAYRWRRFLLRRFGADLHPTAGLRPGVRITHPWLLSVGAQSVVASGVRLYNLGPVRIGAHTVISQDAYICSGTHDYGRRDFPLVRSSVTIGSGVWICAGAFILPGVTIGDNSVVSARAVVSSDVPPCVIVGGNPARVIGERSLEEREP